MRLNYLQLKRAVSTVLFVLLLSAVGMTNVFAFAVGKLNYSVNSDGVSVTVTGHVDGTAATGVLVIPETVTYNGSTYSVTKIGFEAFRNCTGFTGNLVIPNSVTYIDSGAFRHCIGFTGNLFIPNSVTSIGSFTFDSCTGFTGNLIISNSVTSIGTAAFQSCDGFTGNLVIPNSVTAIGDFAFSCTGFTGNLVIPNSVTEISQCAFQGTGFTGNLVIPNSVTTIGSRAFGGCDGFTGNLVIPNSVTSIGYDAFDGCDGFTGNLVIPNSVTTIENRAFYDCTGFTGNLVIPNSVTTIGSSAFHSCTGFSSVVYDATDCADVSELDPPFMYCGGQLIIGENVERIPANMFRSVAFNIILSHAEMPPTVGTDAFYGIDHYMSVYVPCGSLSDYQNAGGWNEFTNILGNGLEITVGALNYSINCDGTTVIVTGYADGQSATGELVIPETVTYNGLTYSVTAIRSSAFYGCTGFTGNLVIPNSVTTIGSAAFRNCTGFTGNLLIPNSVTTIGSSAFYGCSGFTGYLVIPNSVITIGDDAFQSCTGFTGNLFIPNSVITIGDDAFQSCTGFTGNLTIGNSVTTIGDYAFNRCTGFTGNLVIPNSVTSIGDDAFYWCTGFSSVEYDATDCADALSSQPPFGKCSGTLTIGENVERIPANMFCSTKFNLILSHAEMPPAVGTNAFYGINHNIPVYVPCGSLSNYQNAEGWNEFNNIFGCFEVKEITAAVTPANSGAVTGAGTYELGTTCTLTATANPGYTFINWKENGIQVSFDANYSFTVTGDRNLVANFALPLTITATAEPAEGGTVSGAGEYDYGTKCTLTAIPNDGYYFVKWTQNGIEVTRNAMYSFTVTTERDLVANFAINPISQVIAEYYPDANNPESPNVRVQWNYVGDSVAHHFRIYRTKCDDSSPNILITNEEYNNWFVDTTWSHIVGGNYKYGVSCVYEDGKEGGINWSFYNKNHDIPHEIRPSRNNYPNEDTSTGRAPCCIIPENTNLPIFRNQNTECIIAQNGTNFGHFTLNNPSEVTLYGFSIDEFTQGACYMNGTYYFSNSSGTFGTFNSQSGLTVIATGTPYGQIEYNPVDGKLYGLSLGSNATLYEVNPFDGSYTAIAVVPTSYAISFTITNEGRFIVCDMGDDCIKEYVLATGAMIPLIYVDWNINYGQDMAMDMETNEVYWAAFNASNFSAPLIKIDLSNNTLLTIGYFEDQVAAFANATLLQGAPPVWSTPVWSNCIEKLFKLFQVSTMANPTEGGVVVGAGIYAEGDTCTLTATANEGWSFYKWTENGEVISYDPEYSFMVTGDRNLVVNFIVDGSLCSLTIEMYDSYGDGWNGNKLTVSDDLGDYYEVTLANGSSGSTTLSVPDESHVTLGWIMGNWTNECSFNVRYANGDLIYHGEKMGNNFSFEFDMDCSATMFTITVTANPTNSGTVTGAGIYEIGETCTLTATANTGYTFTNWTKNGTVVSTNPSYSFIVTSSGTYVAHFSLNSYTISASVSPSNGGSVSGAGSYFYGVTCTLTATANTGYTFTNWTKNGTVVSTSASYSFTVTSSGTYVAHFSLRSYTISASASPSAGGSVSGAGNYCYGTTCTLTAITNTGYTFTNWTKNGTVVSTSASYSFTVTSSGIYVAHFSLNSYTISALPSPSNGGTVSGGGTYNYGATCTLMASTNTGYTFMNWTKDGTMVSTSTIYSFTVTSSGTYVANFGQNTYTVSALASPSNGGTVSGGGTYNYGATCTLTATTNTGYTFMNWTKDGTVVSSSTIYSFTVTSSGTYVANFGQNTYTISALANPSNGGTVSGGGTYNYGDNCTLTATANTGYNFVNWTKDGTVISTEQTYSFMVTEDASYVANFELNGYTITATANPTEGGTVTGAGTYNYGENCTLTAIANEDYTFVNWTENGEVVSMDAEYSFTVTGNRNLDANFGQNTYTISASAIPSNSGSVNGAGNYYYGETCTLTATPNTGFGFVRWTKNGTHVSTNATYSFTVTENANCVAYFRVSNYIISASANPTEGGTVNGGGTYHYGANCTLTATANEDYTFVNWTENGEVVSMDAEYSFTVTGSRNMVANFGQNTYTIFASANPSNGGTVTGAGIYNHGATCTLTATVNTGYTFINWTKDGTVISTEQTYSFMVTEDASYVANFELNGYTITATANPTEGGTVTGAGTYNYGENCTLTAIANEDYTFVNWTENGEVVSMDAEYSFTVTGNRNLDANFGQNTYTISASAIPSNSGSVSGAGNYYYGDTCTLTATPNTGFSFVRWTKNGTHVSTNATYSFTVTENANCVAYFRVNSYTISASANPAEGGTVNGGGTYHYGANCTLTATANTGYNFVNWTENGTEVSTNAIYSFTVTGNRNLVANFTSDSGGYYWTVNINQYPNTMTAIGVILINDVEQMTNDLELGAFCGTECR